MKKAMLLVCLALSFCAFAQQDSLMAHYPLVSTPDDATGHFGPMVLTNTPFLGGGIYCNGIYIYGGGPDSCQAETPVLPSSIFSAFSVSAKFRVDTIYAPDTTPVFIGGNNFRWVGCVINNDGTILLKYNNNNYQATDLHVSTGTWHEFIITYDSTNTLVKLYFDGVFACSAQCTLNHGSASDRTFSVSDFSAGRTFHGFLQDVRIYSKSILPPLGIKENDDNSSFQLYPNPTNGIFNVEVNSMTGNKISLEIYNHSGKKILAAKDIRQPVSNEINISEFPEGIYIVRLLDGEKTFTKKFVKLE